MANWNSDSLVGKKLGPYRIESKLGAGGMGEVYRAVHEKLGRLVAIKTLKPAIASDRTMLKRFFDEARVVNEIRHENIVEVTDLCEAERLDEHSYMVMELLEGRTLTQAIRQAKRIEPRRCALIAAQIADAIESAHQSGVVHRDLKPDNVFLIRRMGTPDYVKILDFGIASLRPEVGGIGVTKTGAVIGTPAYMSPEQARAEKVTAGADIYALGVIIFQMLTGRLPFEGPSLPEVMFGHMSQNPPPVRELTPNVPDQMAQLVAAMLAKQPVDRPESMKSVRRALLESVGIDPRSSLAAVSSLVSGRPPEKPTALSRADESMWSGPTMDITGKEAASASDPAGRQTNPGGAARSPADPPQASASPADSATAPGSGRARKGVDSSTPRAVPIPSGPSSPAYSGQSPAFPPVPSPRLPSSIGHPDQAPSSPDRSPFAADSSIELNSSPQSHWNRDRDRSSRGPGNGLATAQATPASIDKIEGKRRLSLAIMGVGLAVIAGLVTYALTMRPSGSISDDAPTVQRSEVDADVETSAHEPPQRQRFDKFVASFDEPGAPRDCRSDDVQLLSRLLDAATLLAGGQPGGARRDDEQAVGALAGNRSDAAEYWYWLAKARLYGGVEPPASAPSTLEAASRAIESCPSYAAAHSLRGTVLFRAGRTAEAETHFRDALSLAPEFIAARLNLGLVQLQTNRVNDAIESFSAVISRDSDHAVALISRALAFLKTRDHERAVGDLERATKLDPTHASEAFWLLGQVNNKLGEPDKANRAICMAARLGHKKAASRCRE